MTREQFNALTRDEKIDVMLAAFECNAFTVHCCIDPNRRDAAAKVADVLERRAAVAPSNAVHSR